MGTKLYVGQVLRYPREKSTTEPQVQGYDNFHFVTHSPGKPFALLEAGINPMAKVDGGRRPAVLIRSSPWKAGSEETPWRDVFDLDNGHIRYFGDHKHSSAGDPGNSPGNAALLAAFDLHCAPTAAERASAPPLLVFRSVSRNKQPKGHVEFCGVGIIERAERVVQWSGSGTDRRTFTNYVYDLALLDLTAENEQVEWDWITARRTHATSCSEALELAPSAWKQWVDNGSAALPKLRRRVARSRITKVRDQRPSSSDTAGRLQAVYRRFDDNKHAFEALAAAVAARALRGSGTAYHQGWLTRRSGDGGADFVGRLDIGTGPAATSLVVLGQAKCIKPDGLISAEQIARVVARLRRGWIGVYVTTGSFSEAAQLEMVEDQYPIVLINGATLIHELRAIASEDHGGDLKACVDHLIEQHSPTITNRRPEEILLS
ncbi:restriction endonuclease [Saccharopolyspora flava]|uniref:Restriction endonuclease n=1 Tax=Saccharopolyspora flava TaxID=95161 RepID=A0A1I6QTM0_9PSEU|nr:restriction endonuclease [Saccharopolyspora flava]SFS55781.1 Restriction endonuclease [Saccharopolyspora flava]